MCRCDGDQYDVSITAGRDVSDVVIGVCGDGVERDVHFVQYVPIVKHLVQ